MHQVLMNSIPILQDLLNALKRNPKLSVSIHGHICCMNGNIDGVDLETHTNDLSVQRSKAIYEYLIKNGIDAKRLSYQGLGHSTPIYPFPETSEEQQRLNRRVEIRVVGK